MVENVKGDWNSFLIGLSERIRRSFCGFIAEFEVDEILYGVDFFIQNR